MKSLILSNQEGSQNNAKDSLVMYEEIIKAVELGGIESRHAFIGSEPDLTALINRERPDIVFSAGCFTQAANHSGQNVHALLKRMKVPFIGSEPEILELVLSKIDTKDKWVREGVKTPTYHAINRVDDKHISGLETLTELRNFPYIVKPSNEGSSRGLDKTSVVFTSDELVKKAKKTLQEFDQILIEEYLGMFDDFREFTVAMIGNKDRMLLMPAEIELLQKEDIPVITTAHKNNRGTKATKINDYYFRKELVNLARKALMCVGIEDYGRCDMLYAGGQFFAIEVNGQPLMPDLRFDACALSIGLKREEYINTIFLSGLIRNLMVKKPDDSIIQQMKKVIPQDLFNYLFNN